MSATMGNEQQRADVLLPCPFCGGKAELTGFLGAYVICKACQAEGSYHADSGDAASAWNARVGVAGLIEALLGCRDYLTCIPESDVGGDDEAVRLARMASLALANAGAQS